MGTSISTPDGSLAEFEHDIDISDRTPAAEDEPDAAEHLRMIASSTHDSIVIIDQEGLITFWNVAAQKMFGYSKAEVIGGDCHSLLMPEDNQPSYRKGFRQFQETGTGAAIGKSIELEAKRKNGERFPVELSVSATRVRGQWHAIGIIRDITDRQRREQAIQTAVSQYMAMIDTVPAMVYLKDTANQYVIANKAFRDTVGKGLKEIVGKTDHDIFPREKAEEHYKAAKIVMDEDRRVADHEQSMTDANGETKWVSTTMVPLHNSQGLVSGIVGLVQDVTEYHRSREQLAQADKLAAIGTLAAGVAHEINNPIGFVSSNLGTMRKYLAKVSDYIKRFGKDDDEEGETIRDILADFRDAIDESVEGATRVKNIVADLKSFSRVDRAEKEHACLNEGITSTLNIVWNELKYHCKVQKDFGDIPDLYCMPNQLNQVFLNIVVNAGHAIKGDGGLINVKTWADDANVYVSVKDNGVGIEKGSIKKIFEPFYTTKEVGKGTGLGLSLAYDIIKKHGGTIDVTSEVGVGTEFVITLPQKG